MLIVYVKENMNIAYSDVNGNPSDVNVALLEKLKSIHGKNKTFEIITKDYTLMDGHDYSCEIVNKDGLMDVIIHDVVINKPEPPTETDLLNEKINSLQQKIDSATEAIDFLLMGGM